jgi:hypothetical protein
MAYPSISQGVPSTYSVPTIAQNFEGANMNGLRSLPSKNTQSNARKVFETCKFLIYTIDYFCD